MGTEKESEDKENGKKPDEVVLYKEKVAGQIARFVVGVSLVLLSVLIIVEAFLPGISVSQTAYTFVSGWIGVILGYYFGVVPAEKTAALANEKAETAERKVKKVDTYAQKMIQRIKEPETKDMKGTDIIEAIKEELEFLRIMTD
jgi:hypothetical protein